MSVIGRKKLWNSCEMMNDETKANHDNANNVNIYNHENNHKDAQKGYHKVEYKD